MPVGYFTCLYFRLWDSLPEPLLFQLFHHMVEQSTCLCVLWEENGAGRSAMILTNYGPGSKDPMANLRFYFSNPFYQLSYHLNHCTKRADDAQHRLVGQGVCFCVVSTMTTVSYLAQI